MGSMLSRKRWWMCSAKRAVLCLHIWTALNLASTGWNQLKIAKRTTWIELPPINVDSVSCEPACHFFLCAFLPQFVMNICQRAAARERWEKETTRQKEQTRLTSRCQKSQILYLVCFFVSFQTFAFFSVAFKIRESTLGKRKCSRLT